MQYCNIMFTLNIIILLTFSSAFSQVVDNRCPNDLPDTALMTTLGNTCFQFVEQDKYWTGARDYCWQHGGQLIRIADEETNDFITSALDEFNTWKNNGVWIGLHDRTDELDWKWVTADTNVHESLSWSNWGKGHPEGWLHSGRDCVRMVRNDGWSWHETFCTVFNWQYRFICQYELPEQALEIDIVGMSSQHRLENILSENDTETATEDNNLDSGLTYDDVNNDGPAYAAAHLTGQDGGNNAVARTSHILIPIAAVCAITCFIIAVVLILVKRKRTKNNSEEKDNIKNSATIEHQYSKICSDDPTCTDTKGKDTKERNIYVDSPYPKLLSSKTQKEIMNLKTDPFQLSRRPLPIPEVSERQGKAPSTLAVHKEAEPLSQILLPSPEGGISVSNTYVMPNPKTPTENVDFDEKYENVMKNEEFNAYRNENTNGRGSQTESEYLPMDSVSDSGSARSSVESIAEEDHVYSQIDNEYASLDEIKRPSNRV